MRLKKQHLEEARERQLQVECLPMAAALQDAPPPGGYATGRWPTNLRRALAGADDPRARQDAEANERDRWAGRVSELLQEAQLPLHRISERIADPDRTRMQVVQGFRARTIRKRVRDWMKARSFFMVAHGTPLCLHAAMIIDYVHTLCEA